MRPRVALVGALTLAAAVPALSAPTVVRAVVRERSAASGLDAAVNVARSEGPQPAWIGWAVPSVRQHSSCCGTIGHADNAWCGGCRLEDEDSLGPFEDRGASVATARRSVAPEEERLHVLLRVDGGRIHRVRAFSADCALDVGGRVLHWLTDVRPAESVAFLSTLAGSVPPHALHSRGPVIRDRRTDDEDEDDADDDLEDEGDLVDVDSVAGGALSALALHADPAVDPVLERFVAPGQPYVLRSRAVFWMGVARERRGHATLRRLAREDPDASLRAKVVFALSQSQVPEAVDDMIDMARRDESTRVRGQALFWLSQRAGRKAAAAIEGALRDDPDTSVKKKAVFALSQLPKAEGVPLLIRVARTNRNPTVRKQAMFWLGQSHDPRALEFFEEVLGR